MKFQEIEGRPGNFVGRRDDGENFGMSFDSKDGLWEVFWISPSGDKVFVAETFTGFEAVRKAEQFETP